MSFNPLSTSNLSMALLRYTYHKYRLFLRGTYATCGQRIEQAHDLSGFPGGPAIR